MVRRIGWLTALASTFMLAGLTGCGSDLKLPGGAGGGGGGGGAGGRVYVGQETCRSCHGDVSTHWDATRHAKALAALQTIKQDKPACLPCHTVGYGEASGFKTAAETPKLGNVQCENCHGAGSEHAAKPSAANITRNVPAATCGSCHTDAHHPTYDEYEESKHAKSISDLGTLSPSRDKCIACHSTEGFFYQLAAPTATRTSRQAPSRAKAELPITCWTCHDPHKKTDHGRQLRLGKRALCETCHRLSTASPLDAVPITSTPRHGQSLVYEGTGGLKPNGTVAGLKLTGPNSAHTAAAADGCATCHVYGEKVTSPNQGNPNNTGHSFEANYRSCTQAGCHPKTTRALTDGADPAVMAKRDAAKAQVQAGLAACKPYLTAGDPLYVDPTKLSVPDFNNYNVAKWDYTMVLNMDPSLGVHNLKYSLALLSTAKAVLEALPR